MTPTADEVVAAVKAWAAEHPHEDPSDAPAGPCVACGAWNSNGGVLCMGCADIYLDAVEPKGVE